MIDPAVVKLYRRMRKLYDAGSNKSLVVDEQLRLLLQRPPWAVTMHDVMDEEGAPPNYIRNDMHKTEDWLALRELRRELDGEKVQPCPSPAPPSPRCLSLANAILRRRTSQFEWHSIATYDQPFGALLP